MNKEKILDYLTEESIDFYFDYCPYDGSTIGCSNTDFDEYFLEEMSGYVQSVGYPISGNFIASRENDEIIIESENKIEVNWDYSQDFFSDDNFYEELEDLIHKTFLVKNLDWFYQLNLSMMNSNYFIEIKIFEYDKTKDDYKSRKISTKKFNQDIISFISNSLNCYNDGTIDYEYDLYLTNSEDYNSFVEQFKLKIEL